MEEESSSRSLLLEDFGQKVDLTRRIREVLLNYPEGTTVLKELIQNADDAGATKVCLCLDRRSHATASLLSPKLAQWQGPALLAYNNAVFTEDDFASISRIGGSGKQSQAWKTGRFGVGFNSVYHLTDLPSFVSDKYVVLFDPQGDFLPNISTLNPGKRVDYVTSSAISHYQDQLSPYRAFGCNMETSFPGTIFRFPLRNESQAASSKLSKQAYLPDDISSMFEQLYEEAVFTLLFLKSVLSIEMYVWDTGMLEPKKTYSCCIRLADSDTIWHRQTLLRLSKSMSSSEDKTDGYSLDFLSEDVNGDKRVDTFYIVQTMASTSSKIGSFAKSMSKDYDIHLLPWAAVAACISDNSSKGDVLKDGRAFCFLPLPVKTGMTVQINGYFEVSSNRRGIWYGADMDRSGRIRSLWNRLLLEDVVASSFIKLLLQVQHILGPTSSYYSLWPTGSFEEPWNIMVERIYKSIGDSCVLHSDLDGGKWVSVMEAFLHDNEFCKSNELGKALVQMGLPIVHLPIALRDMLLKFASNLKVVTPDSVRIFLRNSKGIHKLTRDLKLVFIEYCLLYLKPPFQYENFYGLPLLPLSNGLFTEFGHRVYLARGDAYNLLKDSYSDQLLDSEIPYTIYEKLREMGENFHLSFVNCHLLENLFVRILPWQWLHRKEVMWVPGHQGHPTLEWMRLLWNYLNANCDNLNLFSKWPILPVGNNHLVQLFKNSHVIKDDGWSENMSSLLLKTGCLLLRHDIQLRHPHLNKFVQSATASGVLNALSAVCEPEKIGGLFENASEGELHEFRSFILQSKWFSGNGSVNGGGLLNASHVNIIKQIPMFESFKSRKLVSLTKPAKWLKPDGILEGLLDDDFIRIESEKERKLLKKYLDIREPSRVQFYKGSVFNLETSQGKSKPILSSHVFSIKSLNNSSLNIIPEDSNNVVNNTTHVEKPESSRNQKQAIKELEHGRVSAEELVQAAQEMLSAAGIRMNTEKQSLLQTTLSLQERLKESQAALLLEQERSDVAGKEAETAKAAWLCRICLSNEVDITLVPCGHVLCRRCSSAVSRCPFCRLQVSKTIKIYRP